MVFDIVTGLMVVLFAFLGWRAASMLAVMRLVALGVAALGAAMVGPEIAVFHAGKTETCAPNGVVLAWFLIVFVMLWAMIAFLTKAFAEDLRDASIDHATGDRVGGAFVGIATGLLMAYLLVASMQVAKPALGVDPSTGEVKKFLAYEGSAVGRWVDKKNLHDSGILKVHELIQERWSTCFYEYEDEPDRKWIGGRPGLRSKEVDD